MNSGLSKVLEKQKNYSLRANVKAIHNHSSKTGYKSIREMPNVYCHNVLLPYGHHCKSKCQNISELRMIMLIVKNLFSKQFFQNAYAALGQAIAPPITQ